MKSHWRTATSRVSRPWTRRSRAARARRPTSRGVEVLHIRLGGVELAVISEPAGDADALHDLTCAERAVCRELLVGRSNEEIARIRGTSVRTVANQVAAIFTKLAVSSRAELAVFCLDPALRRDLDSD